MKAGGGIGYGRTDITEGKGQTVQKKEEALAGTALGNMNRIHKRFPRQDIDHASQKIRMNQMRMNHIGILRADHPIERKNPPWRSSGQTQKNKFRTAGLECVRNGALLRRRFGHQGDHGHVMPMEAEAAHQFQHDLLRSAVRQFRKNHHQFHRQTPKKRRHPESPDVSTQQQDMNRQKRKFTNGKKGIGESLMMFTIPIWKDLSLAKLTIPN